MWILSASRTGSLTRCPFHRPRETEVISIPSARRKPGSSRFFTGCLADVDSIGFQDRIADPMSTRLQRRSGSSADLFTDADSIGSLVIPAQRTKLLLGPTVLYLLLCAHSRPRSGHPTKKQNVAHKLRGGIGMALAPRKGHDEALGTRPCASQGP
jgi:hypothetical protein